MPRGLRGFLRAGFPPHRAIIKRDSTTIFFNPDLPDDAFEAEGAEAALANWEKEYEGKCTQEALPGRIRDVHATRGRDNAGILVSPLDWHPAFWRTRLA